jgi:hypothetical protein
VSIHAPGDIWFGSVYRVQLEVIHMASWPLGEISKLEFKEVSNYVGSQFCIDIAQTGMLCFKTII